MGEKSFRFAAAVAALFLVVFCSPAESLEKRVGRLAAADDRAWQAGLSITIAYYNICTGWVWIWDDWSPNDVVGVTYPTGSNFTGTLVSTWWFFGDGAPAGYGFTGAVEAWNLDSNECPAGAPIASQSFLPASGWNLITWGDPGVIDFAVTFTFGPGAGSPVEVWTDHPAAGPTGPQACGTCYPSSRNNHSFYFGTTTVPFCPGQPLNDGVCDAQFLQDVQTVFIDYVEPTSWGAVKEMFR